MLLIIFHFYLYRLIHSQWQSLTSVIVLRQAILLPDLCSAVIEVYSECWAHESTMAWKYCYIWYTNDLLCEQAMQFGIKSYCRNYNMFKLLLSKRWSITCFSKIYQMIHTMPEWYINKWILYENALGLLCSIVGCKEEDLIWNPGTCTCLYMTGGRISHGEEDNCRTTSTM